MSSSHIRGLYDRLLASWSIPPGANLIPNLADFYADSFFQKCSAVLHADPIMLTLNPPLIVVGDIHGQYTDMHKFIRLGGPLSEHTYLFLGDYVDRGPNSLEVITFLLCAKVLFPRKVFLLRGNHETEEISEYYGFKEQCELRFGPEQGNDLFRQFNVVFNELPLCAIIGGRVFCVHGGISPEAENVRATVTEANFPRPLQVGEEGVVTDFLWSDPSLQHSGFVESDRGASYTFGQDAADRFLRQNDFDLVVRAHQVVKDGYEFPFPSKTIVTIFSCPNYCGDSQNHGAMLFIGADLDCQFKVVYWNETADAFEKRCAEESVQRELRKSQEEEDWGEEEEEEEKEKEEDTWSSVPSTSSESDDWGDW
jgi:serine/threonine-protein phosphatase PP1 catalytic subunit